MSPALTCSNRTPRDNTALGAAIEDMLRTLFADKPAAVKTDGISDKADKVCTDSTLGGKIIVHRTQIDALRFLQEPLRNWDSPVATRGARDTTPETGQEMQTIKPKGTALTS